MYKKVRSAFGELGFELKKYAENIYILHYEDASIICRIYPDDEHFLQLALPLETSEQSDLYRLANDLNIHLKYLKACVSDNHLWILYERKVTEEDDIKSLLHRTIMALSDALRYYVNLMSCPVGMNDTSN